MRERKREIGVAGRWDTTEIFNRVGPVWTGLDRRTGFIAVEPDFSLDPSIYRFLRTPGLSPGGDAR